MLGVDQFNYNWEYPYQGLLYPSWGGSGHEGGSFWSPDEQALLQTYSGGQCPPSPGNGTFISDTGMRYTVRENRHDFFLPNNPNQMRCGPIHLLMIGRRGTGPGPATELCTIPTPRVPLRRLAAPQW